MKTIAIVGGTGQTGVTHRLSGLKIIFILLRQVGCQGCSAERLQGEGVGEEP